MSRLELKAPKELKEKLEAIRDSQIQMFLGKSHKDIDNLVEKTDPKVLLKIILRLLLILAKRERI